MRLFRVWNGRLDRVPWSAAASATPFTHRVDEESRFQREIANFAASG